jgi:amidophosphoribosyltransferase
VEQEIGADWLIYQGLDDLRRSATEGNPAITELEDSVFTGRYLTDDVNDGYLRNLEKNRSDMVKALADSDSED